MTLKIVKGKGKKSSGISTEESDKGIFIIEAKNNKSEIGYIADVNGKIAVSPKLIPQVVRFTSYKAAKREINHINSNIQGLELKILGQKQIEEIISADKNLDVVIPASEVKEAYIVGIYDITTKETIGYLAYNSQANNYFMKKTKREVAFWEGLETVNSFITTAKGLIASYTNLELRPEKLKN